MKLVQGVGSPETGACWMSALSYYAGESWSDHPACVPPSIRELCVRLNDAYPTDEEREAMIGPHLFAPIGADPSPASEAERASLCVDYALKAASRAFARAGANLDATRLALVSICDCSLAEKEQASLATVTAADPTDNAAKAANAAANAAYNAAANAAYAAYAAYAAANAAAYAADYSANAANAANAAYDANDAEQERQRLLELILRCVEVGDRTVEVCPERVQNTERFLASIGAAE